MMAAPVEAFFNDYVMVSELGKGTFGAVYRVTSKRDKHKEFALKRVDVRTCKLKDRQYVFHEANSFCELKHPNLIGYHQSFIQDQYVCIVMTYCPDGNLRNYIEKKRGLNEGESISFLQQICKGLKYLHDKDIVHRNLKTTNIFLTIHDDETVLKIGDLGMAKQQDKIVTRYVGTPYYMSPEIVKGQPYNKKTDIWSLGICLYEMATRSKPFDASTVEELNELIRTGKPDEQKFMYSQSMRTLLKCMLNKNPSSRPVIESVIESLQLQYHANVDLDSDNSSNSSISSLRTDPTQCEKPENVLEIVYLPVRMAPQQCRWIETLKISETTIREKIKDDGMMTKINNLIDMTIDMQNSTDFMKEVAKLAGSEIYRTCQFELMVVWNCRKNLLQSVCTIAWDQINQ